MQNDAVLTWLQCAIKPLNRQAQSEAAARQNRLTKPAGALGVLETVALRLAAMQGRVCPQLKQPFICIFAADHGIAAAGVSLFPAEVTAQMVANFAHGGAAISVLARHYGAFFEVVDVGVAADTTALPDVIQAKTALGTANFLQQPAMNVDQLAVALAAGRAAVERALACGADVFMTGEMGIANTTSASALGCVWLDCAADVMTGAGTGLDAAGIAHKSAIIAQALTVHKFDRHDPLAVLATFAGFEIVALCGAYIAAAQAGLPIVVDGFISSIAALAASKINPKVVDWMFFAHVSAEQAHQQVLHALGAQPLLQLQMRLGEGSGAALAWPILQAACLLHGQMATFNEAQVTHV